MTEYYYRVFDPYASVGKPRLARFRVLRRTPKGVWIDEYGVERFILNKARRRWAYPTIELAEDSYRQRKRWQIKHCKRTIAMAERCLTEPINNDFLFLDNETVEPWK